jgi:hypothetical protein
MIDDGNRSITAGQLRKSTLKHKPKLNRKPQPCKNSPTRALKPIGFSCTNHAEHDVAPENPNA